ncbi:DUF2913 family protein [Photobacterium angustum]|uniref:DUF2913 domain-containing protein n=1 Tax=Photobacterium angustum TaxID=661 RepID=A0ABX5H1Q9_PHOAN|nr:DUF2913 family protein [Photobacterium angustum]PSX07017.1 DUF2913 domain-containing protein [Photobacterium angustum]
MKALRNDCQLHDIVVNCLLFLYSNVAQSTQFVTTKRRNELITKYLKPRLKKSEYREVKSELKLLLLASKKPNVNIESKLLELNNTLISRVRSDVDQLFLSLSVLQEDYKIDSKLTNGELNKIENCIYISENDLNIISKSGDILHPIKCFMYTSGLIDTLQNVLNKFDLYLKDFQFSDTHDCYTFFIISSSTSLDEQSASLAISASH